MTRRSRIAPLVVVPLLVAGCGSSSGVPPQDTDEAALVGHVHGLGVNPADGALFVAGHHGVFRVEDGTPQRVADRWQDTMAFTIAGADTFLASGHPDPREDLPPHLGLIESTDAAETWDHLSLQGEADFHALEIVGDRIYGYDATNGRLMTTTDRTTWETIATGPYLDLAATPARPDRVLATSQDGAVVEVRLDGTVRRVEDAPELVMVDATPSGLIVGISSGGEVHSTRALADSWTEAGQVPGSPAALVVTDDAWYVATDEDIVSSQDQGGTWETVLSSSR